MRSKVRNFLLTHVAPGEKIIAAVSGGKDSMALLHVLQALAPELQVSLEAAHFNHRLRREESQRDQDFVADICRRWHIPLRLGQGDVGAYARREGLGVEEAARNLRYEFLLGLEPGAKIATAHTAQDNLETVLMRLTRGAGLGGLCGIPPERGNILRPMLTVTQQEIWTYLEENGIPHVEDSTNGQDDCLRNRIRHHVLPLLEAENPNLTQTVSRMTEILREENQYLDSVACPAGKTLNREEFLALPEVLQYRQLRQLLDIPGVTQGQILAGLELCRREEPSGTVSLPADFFLVREYGKIRLLTRKQETIPSPTTLETDSTVTFGSWRIQCRRGPRPKILPQDTLALDAAQITGPLVLRCREPGDRIRLPGGTKKLSRLMIDEKIPARWRDSMPVVTVNGTIAAILPLKTAAFCRPEAGRDSLLLSATRMEDIE